MEKTDPFDLNQAIKRWREHLEQSPAFQNENLDELEAHLRDSFASLRGGGLSAGEAFIIAAKRIGGGQELAAEFSRINRKSIWLDRALWMLIGIQVWGLTSGLIDSIARNAFAVGWRTFGYSAQPGGLALPVSLFALVQVVAFAASIILCWWLVVRKGGAVWAKVAPWLQRRATFIFCCIAFCLFALVVNVLSSSLSAILFLHQGPEVVGQAMLYSSYSKLWVSPFQITIMIAATLVLARRRLSLGRA